MSDTAHSSDEDYAAMDRWADELEAAEAAGRQVDPDDEAIAAGVEGAETFETAEGTTGVHPRGDVVAAPPAAVDETPGEGPRRRHPSLPALMAGVMDGVVQEVPRALPATPGP
jgi:hypothetical protein